MPRKANIKYLTFKINQDGESQLAQKLEENDDRGFEGRFLMTRLSFKGKCH